MTESSILVRRPTLDDFEQALFCLRAYHGHVLGGVPVADPDFPADTLLTVRNRICVVNLAEHCWVADQDGVLLGFCCWDWLERSTGIAKTVLLSVHREARNRGVGSLLQAARQQEMIEQGAIEVHTWSDDPKAVHWYCRHFGYTQLGKEPIHHCLHLFVAGSKSAWILHRGLVDCSELTHLRRTFVRTELRDQAA